MLELALRCVDNGQTRLNFELQRNAAEKLPREQANGVLDEFGNRYRDGALWCFATVAEHGANHRFALAHGMFNFLGIFDDLGIPDGLASDELVRHADD